MPYLNCPNCRLSVYSAAVYATLDYCPRCDARLGQTRRLFLSPLPGRLMARPATAPGDAIPIPGEPSEPPPAPAPG
jgi:hypothetical protein